jgi:hypothetical protein
MADEKEVSDGNGSLEHSTERGHPSRRISPPPLNRVSQGNEPILDRSRAVPLPSRLAPQQAELLPK